MHTAHTRTIMRALLISLVSSPSIAHTAHNALVLSTGARNVGHRCIRQNKKRNTILLWLDNCEHQAMHIIPDSICDMKCVCGVHRAVASPIQSAIVRIFVFIIIIIIYFQFPFASASSPSESLVSGMVAGALGHGPNV